MAIVTFPFNTSLLFSNILSISRYNKQPIKLPTIFKIISSISKALPIDNCIISITIEIKSVIKKFVHKN